MRNVQKKTWTNVTMLDTTDQGAGCANNILINTTGCIGKSILQFISPQPAAAPAGELVNIEVGWMEIDLWFEPQLDPDCSARDITNEFRVMLVKQTGMLGQDPLSVNLFPDASFSALADWSSTPNVVAKWHHSWEVTQDCAQIAGTDTLELTGEIDLPTLSLFGQLPIGQVSGGGGTLVDGSGTISDVTTDCGVCDIPIDKLDIGNPDSSPSSVLPVTLMFRGSLDTFTQRPDRTFHLRMRKRVNKVFRAYDVLRMYIQYGDPFGHGGQINDVRVYGSVTARVNLS